MKQDAAGLSQGDRQTLIVNAVVASGSATIAELAALTGRSVMTTHRDVDELVSKGLLRKFHGGVSALATSVFESSSEFRLLQATDAKERLAHTAVSFVESGMSLVLDDSTTVLALARLLPSLAPLTVLTNYRPTIDFLRDAPDVRLIAIGGEYSSTHDSYVSPPELTGLDGYTVDVAFQSAPALDAEWVYHPERNAVLMKRGMLKAARRRVLLAHSQKVGLQSLHRLCRIQDFTDVVLTPDADPQVVEQMSGVVSVHLCEPPQ